LNNRVDGEAQTLFTNKTTTPPEGNYAAANTSSCINTGIINCGRYHSSTNSSMHAQNAVFYGESADNFLLPYVDDVAVCID
jgi:hypothetical protein